MGSFPAGLAIHVAAVANGGDLDCLRLVVNQVQHAVVANPNPIAVVPLQFLDTRRTRVVLQCENLGNDAAMNSRNLSENKSVPPVTRKPLSDDSASRRWRSFQR